MTTEVEPFLKGRFALYEKDDGGIHISYRPDDAENVEHHEIPGVAVRLFRDMQETGKIPSMRALIRALRGK